MHEIGCIVGLFGLNSGPFPKTAWTWTQKDIAISGSDLRVVTDGYGVSSASTWLGPTTWLAPLAWLAPAKDHEYIGRRCKACKAKASSESSPRKSALHFCFQPPSTTPKHQKMASQSLPNEVSTQPPLPKRITKTHRKNDKLGSSSTPAAFLRWPRWGYGNFTVCDQEHPHFYR